MDRIAFQTRLDSLLLRGLRRACLILAWFFLGLFLFRFFWFSQRLRVELMVEAAGFGLAFSLLTVACSRVRPLPETVRNLGLLTVAVGALNALALHLILRDPWQTTNFMVTAVATGLVFRATGAFMAGEAMVVGCWLLGVWGFRPHPMVHWSLGLASALVVGIAAHLFLKRLLGELERLNAHDHQLLEDLQAALENVKTLHGLIPICAQCKKVRDDRGYWQNVEQFVTTHTDADFTHGLCPACVEAARREFGLAQRGPADGTAEEPGKNGPL